MLYYVLCVIHKIYRLAERRIRYNNDYFQKLRALHQKILRNLVTYLLELCTPASVNPNYFWFLFSVLHHAIIVTLKTQMSCPFFQCLKSPQHPLRSFNMIFLHPFVVKLKNTFSDGETRLSAHT